MDLQPGTVEKNYKINTQNTCRMSYLDSSVSLSNIWWFNKKHLKSLLGFLCTHSRFYVIIQGFAIFVPYKVIQGFLGTIYSTVHTAPNTTHCTTISTINTVPNTAHALPHSHMCDVPATRMSISDQNHPNGW